jgi:hypothetical protein
MSPLKSDVKTEIMLYLAWAPMVNHGKPNSTNVGRPNCR